MEERSIAHTALASMACSGIFAGYYMHNVHAGTMVFSGLLSLGLFLVVSATIIATAIKKK